VASPKVAAAPVASPVEAPRPATAALIEKLRHQDAEVARDAASMLGRLPEDSAAVAALSAVLLNVDGFFHAVVRAAAAESLGLLGDRSAVDALIHATGDQMAETSQAAIQALGLLGDKRALPTLTTIQRNANGYYLEFVQRTAASAAARISR